MEASPWLYHVVLGVGYFVVLWVVTSVGSARIAGSFFAALLIGFLTTAFGWLTYLGVSSAIDGQVWVQVPWKLILIVVLLMALAGVYLLTFDDPRVIVGIAVLILLGGVVAVLGGIGLAELTRIYVNQHLLDYVIVSLLVSMAVGILARTTA